MKLHISSGNMKLGKLPNISLIPRLSCGNKKPCFEKCYAKKATYRPNVKKAWTENWELWESDPLEYKQQLDTYLEKHKPTRFRWHVGGDIPDIKYYKMMRSLSGHHPETKFLAFTKNAEVLKFPSTSNLQIIYSRWPGDREPKDKPSRQAWLHDPNNLDLRIPFTAFKCPGTCKNCSYCFDYGSGDVLFHIH